MTTSLTKLVHFAGEDHALVNQAKEAVEWLAGKPGIITKLEEAKILHGKPLPIYTSHTITPSGYGITALENGRQIATHGIMFNPHDLAEMQLKSADGSLLAMTQRRFFAHEFAHAAQPGVLQAAIEYASRRQQITEEVAREFKLTEIFDPCQYENRFEVIKDKPDKIRMLFEEIYDAHIAPIASRMELAHNAGIAKVARDPKITQYFREYEEPAIAFENQILHGHEPPRTTDYLASQNADEAFAVLRDKNRWVDANCKSCEAAIAARKAKASAAKKETGL